MKKLFSPDTLLLLCIIASVVLLIAPSFSPTIRATGDGFAHKFREASFITSLQEGNFRPRWLKDQALGYGTPTMLYNFSFPYYVVAGINVIVHSIEKSSQLYAAIIIFATFVSMYMFTQKMYGRNIGLVSALFYIGTPTVIYSFYGLEGWGQMTAFLFPPLLLFEGLLLKDKITVQRSVSFVITWVLFINTHNVSALLAVLPIACILSVLVGVAKNTLSFMTRLFFAAGIMCSFLWLPAIVLSSWIQFKELILYHESVRQYSFLSLNDYITRSVETLATGGVSLHSGTPGFLIFLILIVSLVFIVTILFQKRVLYKQNVHDSLLYPLMLFLFTFTSLLMTTHVSLPIWKTGILNFVLQYPARFMFIVPFTGTLLCSWVLHKLPNTWLYIVLCVFIVTLARPFTKPIFQFTFDDQYFENNIHLVDWAYGTRMSMGTVEFLPTWMNTEFIRQQQQVYVQTNRLPEKIEIKPDQGTVLEQTIQSERMDFRVETYVDADVVVNTAYFPTWTATVNSQSQHVNRDRFGRMLIHLPKGNNTVTLTLGSSTIEIWGYVLSVVGVAYLIYMLVRFRFRRKHMH